MDNSTIIHFIISISKMKKSNSLLGILGTFLYYIELSTESISVLMMCIYGIYKTSIYKNLKKQSLIEKKYRDFRNPSTIKL